MYLWLKLIHILAVVLFLGNIITGVFWHRHAASTRDPKILAHTAAGLTQSDRIFTIPAVLLIVLAGIAAAIWILWTLILFSISGFAFMAQVAPLQRKLHALAAAGAAGGTFDYAAYHKVAGRWEFWGAIATLAPIVGLALMVLKPVL